MIENLLLKFEYRYEIFIQESLFKSLLQVENQFQIKHILIVIISLIALLAIVVIYLALKSKSKRKNQQQHEIQEVIQDEENQQLNQNDNDQNQDIILYQKAFQLVNQRFYIPSFKERQVEDEYLKKFIRDFKNLQEYQEEYNLDGSQNQQLNNQIKLFIPIRGDGNCLFTSIGFQYLYYNLIDAKRFQILLKLIDKIEFKQNYQDQSIEKCEDQDVLGEEFKAQLKRFIQIKDQQQLLQQLAKSINNYEGSFYGLLIIFMRNYFRHILQEFYDNDQEMNFLIQEPDQINEIITWEFMYNETDIALKLFAKKEQILIRCYQKMNVDDKIVQISEYKDDEHNQFQYKIGLAFQPGHYNAILLNS